MGTFARRWLPITPRVRSLPSPLDTRIRSIIYGLRFLLGSHDLRVQLAQSLEIREPFFHGRAGIPASGSRCKRFFVAMARARSTLSVSKPTGRRFSQLLTASPLGVRKVTGRSTVARRLSVSSAGEEANRSEPYIAPTPPPRASSETAVAQTPYAIRFSSGQRMSCRLYIGDAADPFSGPPETI